MLKKQEEKTGRIQGWIKESTEREFNACYHEMAAQVAREQGKKLNLGDFLDLVIQKGLKALKEKK